MPGLSLRGLDESAWRRRMDVAVDGRQRNGIEVGRLGKGDVGALKVQRVMDIPDIPHHEPTRPAEPKTRE